MKHLNKIKKIILHKTKQKNNPLTFGKHRNKRKNQSKIESKTAERATQHRRHTRPTVFVCVCVCVFWARSTVKPHYSSIVLGRGHAAGGAHTVGAPLPPKRQEGAQPQQ